MRGWCFHLGLSMALLVPASAMAESRTVALASASKTAEPIVSGLSSTLRTDEWNARVVTGALPARARSLESSMSQPRERADVADRARAAGATVDADAVVLVRVVRTQHARRVTLLVVDTSGAAPPQEMQLALPPRATARDGEKVTAALQPLLAKVPRRAASTAADPEPLVGDDGPTLATGSDAAVATAQPPTAAAARETSSSHDAPASGVASAERDTSTRPVASREPAPFVRLAVVGGVASRSFSYNDQLSSALRSYDLGAVPTLGGRLEVYPFARSRAAAGVGAYGSATTAVGLSSQSTRETASSQWLRGDVGVRALFPAGRVHVGGAFGYGHESFDVGLPGAGAVPNVSYSFLRPALEANVKLASITLGASAAYLVVLSGGEAAGRVRGASIGGVEARAYVGTPLGRYFEASLGAAYTRFFYSFDPNARDELVAGGALDQMMRGELALAGKY